MPDQTDPQPAPLDGKELQRKIASLGINSPENKPKYSKFVLIALAVVALVASIPLTIYLVRQRQEIRKEAVQDQFQCVSGCDGRVCEAQDTNYTWCSVDTRCVCTAPGQAAPHADQYWCEGDNTMYCSEITAGNCGTKVDAQDRANCGGGDAQCDHYSDCFTQVECEWPASTYCVSGQCACADVGEQQEIAASRPGWAVCQDTQPQCTPNSCPEGWQDCGLNYNRTDLSSECIKSVMCGPASCSGCENTYVVWRYCKPAAPTSTPRLTGTTTPILTITPTATVTPTRTLTPTGTRTPTGTTSPTPTGTPQPQLTPTGTVTPVPTATPRPSATNTPTAAPVATATPTRGVLPEAGVLFPTFGALLGGLAVIIGGLLLFI